MKYLIILFAGVLSFSESSCLAANWGFGVKQGVEYQEWVDEVAIQGVEQKQNDNILNIIKGVLNRVLGILGLIALLVLLWGGFQMLTAAGDDAKFGSGQSYMKTAGTALLYIAIAWFVVSIIFYLLNLATT